MYKNIYNIYVIQHLHPTSHFSIPSPRPPPLMQWSFSLGGGHRFAMWHHLVAKRSLRGSMAPVVVQQVVFQGSPKQMPRNLKALGNSPEFSGKGKQVTSDYLFGMGFKVMFQFLLNVNVGPTVKKGLPRKPESWGLVSVLEALLRAILKGFIDRYCVLAIDVIHRKL